MAEHTCGYGEIYGHGYGGGGAGGGETSGLRLLSATSIGPRATALLFNRTLIDNPARLAPASYEVAPGATVIAVHDVGDVRQVALEVADDLDLGTDYTVTIVGDLEGL